MTITQALKIATCSLAVVVGIKIAFNSAAQAQVAPRSPVAATNRPVTIPYQNDGRLTCDRDGLSGSVVFADSRGLSKITFRSEPDGTETWLNFVYTDPPGSTEIAIFSDGTAAVPYADSSDLQVYNLWPNGALTPILPDQVSAVYEDMAKSIVRGCLTATSMAASPRGPSG